MDNRRKQLWVETGFQKKTIIQLMVLVVGSILAAHLLALAYMKLSQAPNISAGLDHFSNSVKTSLQTSGNSGQLWIPIAITCLLGIFFVLGFGLLYSHRIAGPLFNLKRMLHRIGQGELNVIMHIRTHDEFHDVQDAFNQMVANLSQRHETLRQALEKLPDAHKNKILKLWNELFMTTKVQETVLEEQNV